MIARKVRLRLDLEDFRKHYASLSDEALLALDRTELIVDAQICYDAEVERRYLNIQTEPELSREREIESMLPMTPLGDKKASSTIDGGEAPDWLDTAACACAFSTRPGDDGAAQLENAREVLESAGIPCYVVVHESDPLSVTSSPTQEYELMVPGPFSLQAQSILDKGIFNPRMEAIWRTHFELLSDEDLHTMSPQTLTEGLTDRIERLTRVYNEEVSRRKRAAR